MGGSALRFRPWGDWVRHGWNLQASRRHWKVRQKAGTGGNTLTTIVTASVPSCPTARAALRLDLSLSQLGLCWWWKAHSFFHCLLLASGGHLRKCGREQVQEEENQCCHCCLLPSLALCTATAHGCNGAGVALGLPLHLGQQGTVAALVEWGITTLLHPLLPHPQICHCLQALHKQNL